MAFSSAGETDSDASERRIAFYLKQGLSFPAARARAYAEIAPDAGNTEAFASPNNILAVEYLRALASIAPGISPIAVPRTGAAHDAPCACAETGFASASALREAAERCDMLLLRSAAPAQVAAEIEAAVMALHAPKSAAHLSDAILYALRREARTALASLPDVSEGLENVLYEKARSCTDYPAFLAAVKTKRYTLARLRRIAMHALLAALSERASLPVVTGYQDYAALDGMAKEQFALDLFAGELLSMAAPAPEAASSEFSRPLLIV